MCNIFKKIWIYWNIFCRNKIKVYQLVVLIISVQLCHLAESVFPSSQQVKVTVNLMRFPPVKMLIRMRQRSTPWEDNDPDLPFSCWRAFTNRRSDPNAICSSLWLNDPIQDGKSSRALQRNQASCLFLNDRWEIWPGKRPVTLRTTMLEWGWRLKDGKVRLCPSCFDC